MQLMPRATHPLRVGRGARGIICGGRTALSSLQKQFQDSFSSTLYSDQFISFSLPTTLHVSKPLLGLEKYSGQIEKVTQESPEVFKVHIILLRLQECCLSRSCHESKSNLQSSGCEQRTVPQSRLALLLCPYGNILFWYFWFTDFLKLGLGYLTENRVPTILTINNSTSCIF